MEPLAHGDELRTDLAAVEAKIQEVGGPVSLKFKIDELFCVITVQTILICSLRYVVYVFRIPVLCRLFHAKRM